MALEGERFKVHETEDQDSHYFVNANEDEDIHPNELSGDENGEQSVLASNLEGQKANFLLTVTTVVKTVIGAGILSIPFSMAQLGYLMGSIVIVVAGAIAQFTSVLLLKAKNLSHHSNYSSIFYQIWKSKVAKGVSSVLIVLNNIGICIAEMIIFKTSIRKIFHDTFGDHQAFDLFITQEWFIVLILSLLETPLTLVSKMEKLKFMALCGVFGITLFTIAFVLFFIIASVDNDPDNQPVGGMRLFPEDWLSALAAIPNLILALNYQMNFFPIFKGMKNVTDRKMSLATTIGITFCVICYALVGVLGYDYVGHNAKANFLESLTYSKLGAGFYFVINLTFLTSIFFAFPIMFFGCRNNFIAIAKLILLKEQQIKQQNWRRGDEVEEISSYIKTEAKADRKKKAKLHFYLYTGFIYAVIVGVAMGVEDIEGVFNIVGAICSTSIMILLPTFFYVKLIGSKKQSKGLKYYLSLIIFGVMAPYALFAIIAQQIKSS